MDWVNFTEEECPGCGQEVQALTEDTPKDGDTAKCSSCDWKGKVYESIAGEVFLAVGNLSMLCEDHGKLACIYCQGEKTVYRNPTSSSRGLTRNKK